MYMAEPFQAKSKVADYHCLLEWQGICLETAQTVCSRGAARLWFGDSLLTRPQKTARDGLRTTGLRGRRGAARDGLRTTGLRVRRVACQVVRPVDVSEAGALTMSSRRLELPHTGTSAGRECQNILIFADKNQEFSYFGLPRTACAVLLK